jgi:hypothetical protein
LETTVTIRIDAATDRKLDRLAREAHTSRSDIVRRALKQLKTGASDDGESSAYSRVADLVGCISSGSGERSTDTGKGYAALLRSRRRR